MLMINPHTSLTFIRDHVVDNVNKSRPEQVVGNFYDISRAHSYQQITWGTIEQQEIFNFVK